MLRMAHDLASEDDLTPIQQRGQELVDRLRSGDDIPAEAPPSHSLPRIGVALGGGSARGLTHIPYIEAMDELGLKPSVIAGTSIGALLGSGWANGMSGAELRDHSFTVLGTMRTIAGRIWGRKFRDIGALFHNGLSMQLDAAQVVDNFLPEAFAMNFEDLGIPFYVVATDFQSWHQVVFNAGPLRPAFSSWSPTAC